MKKAKIVLVPVIFGLLFGCSSAFAAENFSVSSSNVKVGDSFTVSLSLDAVAAWNVHIEASGPVEGCKLADADVTEDAKNIEKKFVANCKTIKQGEVVVSLFGDYTTADGQTKDLKNSVRVTVNKNNDTDDDEGDDDEGEGEREGEGEGEGEDGIIPDVAETGGGGSTGSSNTGFFTKNGNGFVQIAAGTAVVVAILLGILLFRNKRKKNA